MRFAIKQNTPLTSCVYRMVLQGDTSAITAPGQFVQVQVPGFYLRRPISVCDWDSETLTLVYKVVGNGTDAMCRMIPGTELDLLTGLGNGFDITRCGERPLLIGGGVGLPPMVGLCRCLMQAGKHPTVLAGFNTADEVFLREDVEKLGAPFVLATMDGSAGIKGLVTDALPERFAVKWNFGCGYNLICTDKSALDTNAAEKQLRAWGREPFWAYYSELQYRHVEKKLLVEEYIGSADGTLPEDYKFYCFHGRADCVMLCVGRDEGWPKFYFFDRDFRLLRINRDSQAAPEDFTLPKPAGLDEAFAIADRLSKPFDFVRVDLYLTPRGVRFGELTFTPAAALDNKRLPETDLRFGRRMEETL